MSTRRQDLLRRSYAALPTVVKRAVRRGLRAAPYPWSEGLTYGRLYHQFWRSQWLGAGALESLQLRELRRVLAHAAHSVPAYRERFADADFDWTKLRHTSELSALPLTSKPDLQDDPEGFVSNHVPESEIVRRTTSGSTGTPLTVALTRGTILAERAMMYRGWAWSGYRPGDRVVTCVGELTGNIDGPAHAPFVRYRGSLEISPHHLSERGMDAYIDLILSFQPRFIRTYPSLARVLGKRMTERGLRATTVRGVWTQSEILFPSDRALVRRTWGAACFDMYGMQEKCVAMSECEHGRMHVHSEFGVLELVPSATPPLCHIVATGFHNPAMPLIRYQTRDLAEPYHDACPCGRALPTVKRIVGRMEDFLYATDGRRIMEIDAVIAEVPRIRECQIIQESPTSVRVALVPAPGYTADDEHELRSQLHTCLGADMNLSVDLCESLPKTDTGKQRFIVSMIDPDPTA